MSPANSKKPLIPYIRQSQKKEQTISIDEQKRAITKWAEGAGVKLAPAVVEQGVSGSKSWRDRELGAAVAACENGEASGIIVAFQDRLSRENGLATAEVWEALERAGARLVCACEGLDTATGDHEMLFSIKAAIAREQWKRHRTNWTSAKHSAWERGVYVSSAPAGYGKDEDGKLIPDRNGHCKAVVTAFECYADGGSYGAAAKVLTDAGVATSHGRTTWTPTAARTVLANDVYLGVHGCTCGCGQEKQGHPAIIERALWLRAQRKKGTVKKASKGDGEGQMLGGLLKCASCGYGMSCDSSTKGGRVYRYWRCKANPACTAPALISDAKVAPYIVAAVLEHVGTVTGEDGPDEARISELRAGVTKADADLVALDAMLASDEVDAITFATASAAARRQRDALAVELAELEQDAVATKWYIPGPNDRDYIEDGEHTTRAVFERMPVPVQRQALSLVLARATVAPGRAECHERVEIEWTA